MNSRLIILTILIGFIVLGCGSSKTAKRNAEQMEQAPQWVKQRPVSNMYYIGIARVNKLNYPDNYRDVAKRKALNDLASEISVNIQSNSIASSYEDQSGFRSDFSNYIQMEMSKDLAGYQMVGSYETDNDYMVYYRLSKAKWKEIQAERKKAAADRAAVLFRQGRKKETELDYPAAIKSYLNALLELKKYWNEAVYYKDNEEKKRLDLEIQNALTHILSDFDLRVSPDKLHLNMDNGYKSSLSVSVINSEGKHLSGFPVRVYYRKKSIPYQATVFTNSKETEVAVEDLQYRDDAIYVKLEIDRDEVLPIKSEDKKFLKSITDAWRANPVSVPVAYSLPTVYIQSPAGQDKNYVMLESAIKGLLGKYSFPVTGNRKLADLVFKIRTNESSSVQNKVKNSFLSYSIEIINPKQKQTLRTFTSPKYKGVDYNVKVARDKAYTKAAEEINESGLRTVLLRLI
jgi:hypothetical protein